MTNTERAARARKAFEAVQHDDNDPLTNLTDLICDMLHLADVFNRESTDGVEYDIGEWAAERATMHYRAEVEEAVLAEPPQAELVAYLDRGREPADCIPGCDPGDCACTT